jgi:hypothetical protein
MSAKPRVRRQIEGRSEQDPGAAGGKNAADTFRRQLPLMAAVLDKALQGDGCVLCRAVEDVEAKSIFTFLYEGMTMPATREAFVDAGGFCPRHFRVRGAVRNCKLLSITYDTRRGKYSAPAGRKMVCPAEA